MDRLPMELIIKVLTHADQKDLHSAAGVSREFYKAAQAAGCLLLRKVHFGGFGGHEKALATFDEAVEHALAKPDIYRPGLALRLFVHRTPGDFEEPFEHVLLTIDKAMPLMVALDAYVPAARMDRLHHLLCEAAAPRLRSLVLCQVNDGRWGVISPPVNLFAGGAPRLRTLTLGLPNIERLWPPVAVFQCIDTAHLILYRPAERLYVSKLLPRVRSLIVTLDWDDVSPPLSVEIDLSGLKLCYLALGGHRRIDCEISGIDVCNIPVVEGGLGGGFADGFWDTHSPSNAPISMRIGPTVDALKGGAHATGLTCMSWKRVAYSKTASKSPALTTMVDLAMRLTVVSVDCRYLTGFLGTDVLLPALKEFCIEAHGGLGVLDGKLSACLSCPALSSVTLFVYDPLILKDVPLPFGLRIERVTTLGKLLRLEERPSEERATLRLDKVSFVEPIAIAQRKRFDSVFPKIEYVSEPDCELLRLAASCSNQVMDPLAPFDLVRYP